MRTWNWRTNPLLCVEWVIELVYAYDLHGYISTGIKFEADTCPGETGVSTLRAITLICASEFKLRLRFAAYLQSEYIISIMLIFLTTTSTILSLRSLLRDFRDLSHDLKLSASELHDPYAGDEDEEDEEGNKDDAEDSADSDGHDNDEQQPDQNVEETGHQESFVGAPARSPTPTPTPLRSPIQLPALSLHVSQHSSLHTAEEREEEAAEEEATQEAEIVAKIAEEVEAEEENVVVKKSSLIHTVSLMMISIRNYPMNSSIIFFKKKYIYL
jgi:hypothetical protein